MSTSRYVSRHGNRRRSPLSRLGSLPSSVGSNGARAAAKTVAGLGIVLGSGAFVIAPTSAVGTDSTAALSAVGTSDTTATELLADRTGKPGASRSATRTHASVTAPAGDDAQDVHTSAGSLAVDAVVKPKPKPKPKPVEVEPAEDTQATEQTSDVTDQTASTAETPQTESAPQATADSSSTQSSTSDAPSDGAVSTSNYGAQAAGLGLGANAQKVYSAVRTQFPDMTDIGGYRAGDGGDHGTGNAVDIMVTGARGDQIAAWLQAHAGELNIKYVIWQQRIWLPGSSWRGMEDRGDPTQNHFDHVHVSVN